MRGHIEERKDRNGKSLFYAVVYIGRDDKGHKRYKWLKANGKRDAERRLAEAIHEMNVGDYVDPKGALGDFIERWLKEYAKPNLSPRTVEGYESIYKTHIGPSLGKLQLKDVRPERIQAFYASRLEMGLSTTTVRHHAMMLHRVLEHAVKWQLLARNPADAVTPPVARHIEMRTLDEAAAETVLEAAKDTPYFPLFHLGLYTGIRRSEMLAVRWRDTDLLMADISISRSMHRLLDHQIVFRGTKTAKSSRKVALDPVTCGVLRQHRSNEIALCKTLQIKFTEDRLVFCHWDGSPLLPSTVSQAWRRLTRGLGFNNIRFHDLRHSHATLMLKAGVHPKVVQERLGHSSIAITLDTYSHVMPGMQHHAAETFAKMLDPNIRQGQDETSSNSHDTANAQSQK